MSRQQTPEDETRDEQTEMACVIGGRHVGNAVAAQLSDRGFSVTYVDQSTPTEPPPGVQFVEVGRLDSAALRTVDMDDPAVVLVVGSTDSQNLLLTQLARTVFDTDNVVTLVNDPERGVAFDDIGVRTVEAPRMIANEVANHI